VNGLFAIGNMQRPSWTAAGLFRPRSEGGQNKDLRLRRYRRARPLPLRSESNPLLDGVPRQIHAVGARRPVLISDAPKPCRRALKLGDKGQD
jgi:hypothetical protein